MAERLLTEVGDYNKAHLIPTVRQELRDPVIHRMNFQGFEQGLLENAQDAYIHHITEARAILSGVDSGIGKYLFSNNYPDVVDVWNDLVNGCMTNEYKASCTARKSAEVDTKYSFAFYENRKISHALDKIPNKSQRYKEINHRYQTAMSLLESGIRALVPRITSPELHYALVGREVAHDLGCRIVARTSDDYQLDEQTLIDIRSSLSRDDAGKVGALGIGILTQDIELTKNCTNEFSQLTQVQEARIPVEDFPYTEPLMLDAGKLPEHVQSYSDLRQYYVGLLNKVIEDFNL